MWSCALWILVEEEDELLRKSSTNKLFRKSCSSNDGEFCSNSSTSTRRSRTSQNGEKQTHKFIIISILCSYLFIVVIASSGDFTINMIILILITLLIRIRVIMIICFQTRCDTADQHLERESQKNEDPEQVSIINHLYHLSFDPYSSSH